MIETRVFDVDPMYNILRLWHYDTDTDKVTIETRQGANDTYNGLLDLNASERNQTTAKTPYRDGMHHVARIPLVILEELQRKGITRDQKAMKKWLNDPDNRFFRTREGKV
ncbi:MAG TPA: hypothetical protein VJ840_18780 [Gemmatimonadaceae bacterium]|nr:hypothetical protein [Gemmatimonadaceae bacterium]